MHSIQEQHILYLAYEEFVIEPLLYETVSPKTM